MREPLCEHDWVGDDNCAYCDRDNYSSQMMAEERRANDLAALIERQAKELADARGTCVTHNYNFKDRFEFGCPSCAEIELLLAERDARIAALEREIEAYRAYVASAIETSRQADWHIGRTHKERLDAALDAVRSG